MKYYQSANFVEFHNILVVFLERIHTLKLLLKYLKKEKIFYSYLLSYLFVGIISLTLSIVGYINSERIMREETLASQSSMLTQLHSTFDNYLRTSINSLEGLSDNDNINALMFSKTFTQSQILRIPKLKSELNSYKKGMDFCSEVAVYFYNSKNIVTHNKRFIERINYLYPAKYQLTIEEYLQYIDIPEEQGYKIIKAGDSYSILFLQNIYSYKGTNKLATVIVVVPWENIASSIAVNSRGSIYWINQENQILSSDNNEEELGRFKYYDFQRENRLITTKIGSKEYVSSYKQSDYFDLKYCITTLESSFYAQLNYLKLVILIQLTITLLIAIGIGIYFSYRNYHPLQQIMSVFQKHNHATGDPVSFDRIEYNIEKLYSENINLSNSYQQSKAEKVILGYIKGWHSDLTSVRDTIRATEGITLKESHYIAIIATYHNISKCKLFADPKSTDEAEVYQLLQYIFKNVFDEQIFSKYSGLICNYDEKHLCVINVNNLESDVNALTNEITECVKWYMEALNLEIIIGASNIHDDFETLPNAYNEASQVLSYQSFWGFESEAPLFYHESGSAFDMTENSGVQFLDNEKRFYNLLVTKSYDEAYTLLDKIMDDMFIKDINYMEINQCRMFSLINTIFIYLNDTVGKNDEMFMQNLQRMKQMFKGNSLESAKIVMKEIFSDIISYMETNTTEELPKWITEVIDYVNEHFRDENLNISTLADRLNMNLSYVGRTFKKYMGYNLIDYIHMQRLKECKRLLEAGKSVKDAAEAVGYLDSKTLIRIFKKYEGITPGQFKNNIAQP